MKFDGLTSPAVVEVIDRIWHYLEQRFSNQITPRPRLNHMLQFLNIIGKVVLFHIPLNQQKGFQMVKH